MDKARRFERACYTGVHEWKNLYSHHKSISVLLKKGITELPELF
jgi:hypothetical protein